MGAQGNRALQGFLLLQLPGLCSKAVLPEHEHNLDRSSLPPSRPTEPALHSGSRARVTHPHTVQPLGPPGSTRPRTPPRSQSHVAGQHQCHPWKTRLALEAGKRVSTSHPMALIPACNMVLYPPPPPKMLLGSPRHPETPCHPRRSEPSCWVTASPAHGQSAPAVGVRLPQHVRGCPLCSSSPDTATRATTHCPPAPSEGHICSRVGYLRGQKL